MKSHWLNSKQNRCIDRVIYTLVQQLEPYYQSWHARQTIGFEGPDLTAARREEIKASTRDISLDLVLNFNSAHFHVASQSRPGKFYVIDLIQSTCNCPDFPRIWFCKHIAAVEVHFPHLCPEENTAPIIPRDLTVPSQPECVPISSHNALQAVTQELALSLQTLISTTKTMDHLADHLAIIEAAWSANYSLLVANASLQGTCALPEKDIIPPNQKTWLEMAAHMEAKMST